MPTSKKALIASTRNPAPAAPEPKPQPETPAAVYTGRTAALWLDDEDRALLKELTVTAVQHDIRPSDSLIVRAALRLVVRDPRVIEQMRELLERDGRKLRHQKQGRPMDH
jgi:hypothetical protein